MRGGPDLTFNGDADAFVAKVNAAGAALVYAGYIGGRWGDGGNGIAVDAAGNAYIAGGTGSDQATFPVVGGPDLTYNGSGDAFVAQVNATGTALTYAGYIGGQGDYYCSSLWGCDQGNDAGHGIAVDGAANAYVTGSTTSDESTFPEAGGPDPTYNGGYYGDAFVAKVGLGSTPPTPTATPTPTVTPTPAATPIPGPGWQAMGSGMNGGVRALAAGPDGRSLHAGGKFTIASGAAANYVARWDGATSSWQALAGGVDGGGVDGPVAALALGPDGSLYAGGEFTTAGGVTANHVARWDGSAWRALGKGVDGAVAALAVGPDGSLYAGGDFTTAGGVPANHVARWDGATSAWQALGSGADGAVAALALGSDGALYAGGRFTTAGGVAADNVARWDGAAWRALGSGVSDCDWNGCSVSALAVGPDGSLYAGGNFATAGGVAANNVARWDGSAWQALGSGVTRKDGYSDSVSALVVAPDGSLYVAGDFEVAGSVTGRGAARWDRATSSWQPLGSGLCDFFSYYDPYWSSCSISALALEPDGAPFAGVALTRWGEIASDYVAQWIGDLPPALTITGRTQHLGAPPDVQFVDPLHGWSRNGDRRTTDGGLTWLPLPGQGAVTFISPAEGWGSWSNRNEDGTCSPAIWHTTDGGETWATQYLNRYAPCGDYKLLQFVDTLAGWAFDNGAALKTTDGGRTWQPTSKMHGAWEKMLNWNIGLSIEASASCGPPYTLARSTTAGWIWQAVGDLPAWASIPCDVKGYTANYFRKGGPYIAAGGKLIIVTGTAGRIARSTDGGAT